MKVNDYALVLLWRGKELSDYQIEKITEILTTNGVTVPELLKATYMDHEGIAQALVRDQHSNSTDSGDENNLTPVESAAIYIGTKYKDLITSRKYLNFALTLARDVSTARNNVGFNALHSSDDEAVLNAVEILASPVSLSEQLRKEYDITRQVLQIIKQVHNQYS